MSIAPDMAERHTHVLSRLTEMGLALAERTFEDAEAAETPEQRVERVKAFHTISRSVRQTVALEAKLARQQVLDAREVERVAAVAPPRRPSGVELSRRIDTVRDAVTRVIWHEADDDDCAAWLEEQLGLDLAHDCRSDDFCAEPLDDHIARLCLSMGLPEEAALNWRDLPDPFDVSDDEAETTNAPPPDPGGPEPPPQSSA